jgi:dihydroorotase
MDRLTLIAPDDWHLHLRDGAALAAVVGASAAQFRRAIVMPNLKPPVTTVAAAAAYRARIVQALSRARGEESANGIAERCASFEPLMTLYLTETTPVAEIAAAARSGFVHGVKLYPAGATTNSDAGVRSLDRVMPVLEAMAEHGLPLLVHGEVVDDEVDIFEREAVFIERTLAPLRQRLPTLNVVLEHITTEEAAHYVRDADAAANGPGRLGATITAHHLRYNRNALFKGGLRPHWYCLPVLKRERHRRALIEAATSGNPRYFLGTDSAPHPARLKAHAAACAGCYTAPHALELYVMAFDEAGAIDRLEGFASRHGPAFYRLPINESSIVLERREWRLPEDLPFGDDRIVPLAAGELLGWKLVADRPDDDRHGDPAPLLRGPGSRSRLGT